MRCERKDHCYDDTTGPSWSENREIIWILGGICGLKKNCKTRDFSKSPACNKGKDMLRGKITRGCGWPPPDVNSMQSEYKIKDKYRIFTHNLLTSFPKM